VRRPVVGPTGSAAVIAFEKRIDEVQARERCPPLTDLHQNMDTKLAGIRHRDPKEILIQYGNVFAAFDIGLRICRYWESRRSDIGYTPEMRLQIAKFSIPQRSEYIEDICYTLAEKNISPHSLNMLYKSLFLILRPQT
jgi:hypothetical protein